MPARIILKAAEGSECNPDYQPDAVALANRRQVAGRYAEKGVDGLLDEPRPDQPRKISDGAVERVIVRTLESKPAGAADRYTRSMAQATG